MSISSSVSGSTSQINNPKKMDIPLRSVQELNLFGQRDDLSFKDVFTNQIPFRIEQNTPSGSMILSTNGGLTIDNGAVYANDFITLSRVADMNDGKSALDLLDNIASWKNDDGKVNYSAHYAGITFNYTYVDPTTNKSITTLRHGLSSETRILEMEKMIYELKGKIDEMNITIADITSENNRLKECAKSSGEFASYKACVAG